jgi:hypothetical protein
MVITATVVSGSPRTFWRSTAAVLGGFFSVAALSLAADQLFHVLDVYPPWGQPMYETGDNVLALSYRILFTILGGYITAALAPHAPRRHVAIVGLIGLVAGTAGAVAAIALADLGPAWYPILVAVTGFPCVWVGGLLRTRRA